MKMHNSIYVAVYIYKFEKFSYHLRKILTSSRIRNGMKSIQIWMKMSMHAIIQTDSQK